MNRVTRNIARIKKTGETQLDGPVKISKEEKARHVHPRHKRSEDKADD